MQNLSLILLLLTATVSPWLIGGYTALARYVCVAGLLLSALTMWFDFKDARQAISRHRWIILTVLMLPMMGLIQLLVTRRILPDGFLDWSGVPSLREQFGDSQSFWLLTLSPWLTRSWLVLGAIGAGGFALSVALINSTRARLATLILLSASGVFQVFWGVIQSIRFPNDIFWGIPNPGRSSVFGTFLNCNHAADFIGISLGASLGLAWWWNKTGTRDSPREYRVQGFLQSILSSPVSFLLWLTMGWLLMGILISTSRGAVLSLAVSLILLPFCWRHARSDRPGLLLGIAMFCLTATIIGVQLVGLEDRVQRGLEVVDFEKATNDARFTHWAEAVPAVRYFLPFGSGFGTYGYSYLPFEPQPSNGWFTYAHNQYLEVLMEGGLLALLVVFAIVFTLLRSCLRLFRSNRSSLEQGIGLAGVFVLLMQSIHAFSDFGLMMPANLLAMAVLLGMTVRTSADHSAALLTEVNKPRTYGQRQIGISLAVVLTVGLAAALWQQTLEVKSQRVLEATFFDPTIPSPDLKTINSWRDLIDSEWRQQPQNERLLRRRIQLDIHAAQTESYLAAMNRGLASDIAWEATSVEAAIARLFNNQDLEFNADRKAGVHEAIRNEANLKRAMDGLQESRKLNPIQPRLHYRLAMLRAAFGQPWREDHAAAVRLSVADPRLSLGNGLLAWAARDTNSFTTLWKQSLASNTKQARFIVRLAQQQLSNDEIADRLMPDDSVACYRIAQQLNGLDETILRDKVLHRSLQLANSSGLEQEEALAIKARIFAALGDFQQVVAVREELRDRTPDDPEVHYQLAAAYLRAGQPKEAAVSARIAFRLAPKVESYRLLFQRAQDQHRKQ